MDFSDFETVVEEAYEQMPAEFKDILDEKEIAVIAREKVPEPIKKKYPGMTVFGIFIGVPYGRFTNIQSEPTRIEIYMDSFQSYFGGKSEAAHEEMKKQIQRTVVHEVAHYLGFSEEKIRKLGY